MARAHQIASVVFFLLGIFVLYESVQLRYFTRLGPGPGFFGVWLGGLLAAFAVIFFVQNTLPRWRTDEPLHVLPPRPVRPAIALTILALILTLVLLPVLGFRLTILPLAFILLLVVGRESWPTATVVSLVASFGVYYVFTNLLGVVLPTGIVGF
ncbi:MAG: tripartite tricarboxylate transporter TctB family protein [Chloroflexota bacterium]|nr:tripartite tricarboxylate transporter TctB family protein [Chloroflexota bacterium]